MVSGEFFIVALRANWSYREIFSKMKKDTEISPTVAKSNKLIVE
jgi:hypothetical protein